MGYWLNLWSYPYPGCINPGKHSKGLGYRGKIWDETSAVLCHSEKEAEFGRVSRIGSFLEGTNFFWRRRKFVLGEHITKEFDAWFVELVFLGINGLAQLMESEQGAVKCDVVLFLGAPTHDEIVTQITCVGDVSYQRLDDVLKNFCS